MYTGLLHSHRLFVILFLGIYLVKLVLLLMNRTETLENLTKKIRIPEMIISTLFLLTGIGMLFSVAKITPMILIKLGLVFAAIPIAVIGFKKSNKLLAALSVLLIIGAYGLAEMNKIGVDNQPIVADVITDTGSANYDVSKHGEALYARNCSVCHGEEGNLKGSGAKDLTVTVLDETAMKSLIMNGKNAMPPYKAIYSEVEINAVIAYIKTFKK